MWVEAHDSLAWEKALEDIPHDVYHLPAYVRIDAARDGGHPVAYLGQSGDDKMLVPLIQRPLANSAAVDATSPYGYGGPVYSQHTEPARIAQLLCDFVAAGKEAGLVTSFLRLHPLLNAGLADLGLDENIRVQEAGSTVGVDLTLEPADLHQSLRKSHRRDINKLERLGYKAHINRWQDYSDFQKIYASTMSRLSAASEYYFSDNYFADFRGDLAKQFVLCTIEAPTGELAAGGMFTLESGIAQYHLSATHEDHLKLAPSKLMLKEIRNYFQQVGAHFFHLGGGLGGQEDALFKFKLGFGTATQSFHIAKIVHDREAFDELNRQANIAADNDNFFPPYRQRT